VLSLHNELSYSNNYPSEVYFCCIVAPEVGGETPIGDSREILKNIDRGIVEEFKNKKIKYERNLQGNIPGSGYSWQDAFESEDKSYVEDCCCRIGADFEWRENGSLRLSQIRPATVIHPQTGEEVWFNQADGFHPSNLDEETRALFADDEFRLNARFGDGKPLEVAKLNHIREVMRNEMTTFPWQAGEVLDNLLTAHGRMPFSGKRKIILAMT
jgi:alpha-ketoglutarate-dependent taurine dioxygenase